MKQTAILLTVIFLLLTACTEAVVPDTLAVMTAQASMTPPAQVLTTEAAPSKTVTASATWTRSPTGTPWPTRTPEPSLTPTVPMFPALANATEIPPLGTTGLADLHGLILFYSRVGIPFTSRAIHESDSNSAPISRWCRDVDGYGCLWAISPDAKIVGMLNPGDFDFNMYLPPSGPPQMVENGFTINDPSIQPVQLPEVCSQDPNSGVEQRCDQIRFSPDGRFLAFRYGTDNCGRSLQVIDRKIGETILSVEGGVHRLDFLSNGKMMIMRGHCQGGGVSFFDPFNRQTVAGGGEGPYKVNLSKSILVFDREILMGVGSTMWGYSLKTGTAFYPEGKGGWLYDERAIFLPDDRRFIYQHLKIGTAGKNRPAVFDTPAQIVRYDPISGERKVLASDPAYHYRLCQFDYEKPCATQWYGDWIQVQRVPFMSFSPEGYEWSVASALPCFEDGRQCDAPPESFALNARTGEMRPWDPASLPLAYPTPRPTPGPDLLGKPIYTDPAGKFALYIGADRKSLWMLPSQGPAVQWVRNGEGFFYLP